MPDVAPAGLLDMKEGKLEAGLPADFTIFDPGPRLDRREDHPAKQVEKHPVRRLRRQRNGGVHGGRWSSRSLPARLTHDRPDQLGSYLALYRCGFCGGLSIGVDTIRAGPDQARGARRRAENRLRQYRATNVLRTGNKKLAAATLVLDGAKGAVAVLFADIYEPDIAIVAAAGALLGHLFPVWLKFRGGKGVAIALGILLALSLPVGGLACATWLLAAVLFRYSSLSALLAMAAAPLYMWWLANPQRTEFVAAMAILVWIRHHPEHPTPDTRRRSKDRFSRKG